MDLGDRRPRDRAAAARPAARGRQRPRDRRRDHGAERPLRPVPEEGHRHAARSPSEDQIFAIDLAGALELFAQPKYGARRASSASRSSSADPVSGKPIRVKDGRFGPYVTDGVTNATIPRGERSRTIDFERAVQLLADKRAKGPAPPRSRARQEAGARSAPAAKKR